MRKDPPRNRDERIRLHTIIDGELAARFNEIKRYYQIECDKDLIRLIITQTFERIKRISSGTEEKELIMPSENILGLLISGFVGEGFLEEMVDGKERCYRVKGAGSWVSREIVERTLRDAFSELVRQKVGISKSS
jgi:hypothetical protein